jgi:hypothetical protein
MIILSQIFQHDKQAFEIFVKYDEVEKRPIEVKSICMHTNGRSYPVGNIMTKLFSEDVKKLIAETDWEKVRAEHERDSLLKNIHPVMQQLLRPHLLPGVLNN